MASRDRYAVDRIYYGFGHFAVRPGRKQTRIGTSEAALSNRGALGAPIIFSEVTAIQNIGVTLTISALLIAQLFLTFLIDSNGWFGVVKKRMSLPQFIGIGMMIAGVVIIKL